MSTSARLGLPLLAPGQSQKELFHNEAVQALDVLVAAAVEEPPRDSPPTDPAIGACYIVGNAPNGAWADFENHLAAYTAGGWRIMPPVDGMQALVRSTGLTACFRNGSWQSGVLIASRLIVSGQQVVGARGEAIANPAGGTVVDSEARVAIHSLIARLRDHGLIT